MASLGICSTEKKSQGNMQFQSRISIRIASEV